MSTDYYRKYKKYKMKYRNQVGEGLTEDIQGFFNNSIDFVKTGADKGLGFLTNTTGMFRDGIDNTLDYIDVFKTSKKTHHKGKAVKKKRTKKRTKKGKKKKKSASEE